MYSVYGRDNKRTLIFLGIESRIFVSLFINHSSATGMNAAKRCHRLRRRNARGRGREACSSAGGGDPLLAKCFEAGLDREPVPLHPAQMRLQLRVQRSLTPHRHHSARDPRLVPFGTHGHGAHGRDCLRCRAPARRRSVRGTLPDRVAGAPPPEAQPVSTPTSRKCTEREALVQRFPLISYMLFRLTLDPCRAQPSPSRVSSHRIVPLTQDFNDSRAAQAHYVPLLR